MKKLAWLVPVAFILLVALSLHLWDRFQESRKPTAEDIREAFVRMRQDRERARREQFVRQAKSEDAEVRREAVKSLADYCETSLKARAAIASALADEDSEVRSTAVQVVFRQGAFHKQVVPGLVSLLSSESDDGERVSVIRALGECGAKAAPAVAGLTAALKDRDPEVRRCAAGALGDIGPAARAAAPALREAWHAPENGSEGRLFGSEASWQAAAALGRIGFADEVLPVTRAALNADMSAKAEFADSDAVWKRRRDASAAIEILGHMGELAAPAVPELVAALKPRWIHWMRAAWALGEIGPAAREAIPALLAAPKGRIVETGEEVMIHQVIEAFGKMGSAAKPAVPALVKELRADDFNAGCAARALGRIGPAAKEAIPALTEIAKTHGSAWVRADARTAIHRITKPGVPEPRIGVPLDGGPLMELHEGGIATEIETRPATRPAPSSDTESEDDIAG